MPNDWLPVLQNFGFPIAVAAFVLIRLNGKMERNTAALIGMTASMDVLIERLGVAQRTDFRREIEERLR